MNSITRYPNRVNANEVSDEANDAFHTNEL